VSLDPALARLLEDFQDDGSPFDLMRARDMVDAFAQAVGAAGEDGQTRDEEMAGVAVRRYLPEAPRRGPTLVWCHGGGWVTGSLAAVDPLCRALVARTRAPLVSVAYRLAPEHPFPAALDDCVAVLRAVSLDGPVAVGGDSAGGGLAAAACLQVRPERQRVVGQLLVNPLLDATLSGPSVTELGDGYGLTRRALEQFVELYLQGADAADERCSPLLAADVSGLPPAVVVTAELDPLRDEGHAYADRLAAAQVPVAVRCFPGMVHGFAGMSAVTPVADQALDWMVDALARLTAQEPGH
jgi:acetyl esterase